MLLVLGLPTVSPAQDVPHAPRRPAVLPLLGAGGFPRPRDIESGATEAGQLLVGAALDLPLAPRLLLAITVAGGFQPFACVGGCAPPGSLANLALLWRPASAGAKWGVLLGPSLERTSFDGARMGGGATVAFGALRRVGPRLTLRYHALAGPRHPSSFAGFLAFRLGP